MWRIGTPVRRRIDHWAHAAGDPGRDDMAPATSSPRQWTMVA